MTAVGTSRKRATRRALVAALVAATCAVRPAAAAEPDLAQYVDPMIGTFAPGFIFPGADVPFGMVQNSPDTYGSPFAYGGYLYSDPLIRGFSLVHLSGPGVEKAGDLPFMPTTGPVTSMDPAHYGSPFDHAREHAEAGYYSVHLAKYATDVELTASTHAAMQRYTFPPSPQANVILDVKRGVAGARAGELSFSGPNELSGWTRDRYPVYFVARFSRPFKSKGASWVTFDTLTDRKVTVRIGISFVDVAGARRNLEAEAPGFDFGGMRARARTAWNRALGAVKVSGGTTGQRRTFYTALYRAQLHPNVFTDVDGRYRGFDHQVHVAKGRTQYANFSLWDTYKGENQLLATIRPGRYREMLLSLLDDQRLGGKLPRWGEQDYDAAHMSGDPAVPMIVDGYCRGLVAPSDAGPLYEAAKALRSERSPDLGSKGYLPGNAGTTLEYGIADFALAVMARGLGRDADAAALVKDALRYRNLLDPETRWIRPRGPDGSWRDPFAPTDEEGFQEGNSWQYSWLAPHDARGLFDRMGGNDAALDRLNQMFSEPPDAQVAQNGFGTQYKTDQYSPGNEHDLQIPWLFPFARQPWRTAAITRSLRTVFRASPAGLPGNDDLGGLSGWYVWNALGISPVTPGAPFYVIGSPMFERSRIGSLTIEAPGVSDNRQYVMSAKLGGKPLGRAWLYDSEWRRGKKLSLNMGNKEGASWGTSPKSVPPSITGASLQRFGCAPARARTNPPAPSGPRARDQRHVRRGPMHVRTERHHR
jgi:predicted alpha-1,2-mannosidase